ncbi:MAG: HEAT repeat domain-containing protein [Myxococcota bacterium]|nr:HEAT repeat domain-containing protein [Myxococcota bacterium]
MTKHGKTPAATANPTPAPGDEAAAPVEVKPDAKPDAKDAKPAGNPPPFDERKLKFEELAPFGKLFEIDHLVVLARDGRAIVRANAALGLAAAGQPVGELVTMLRDSEPAAALAAAEAIARLGAAIRPFIPQITLAVDGTKPDVTGVLIDALAALIGIADDELTSALDVPHELAMKSIVEACREVGIQGISFLIAAVGHERSRVRINAIGGLERLGKLDADRTLRFLADVEANDPVPDVRTAAKQAMLAVVARGKVAAVDSLPKHIPDFEARKLGASELHEYDSVIDVDEMVHALRDGRAHVRVNAARALAIKGDKAARAAKSIGLLLRDSVEPVRREAARALGKLGAGAIEAAPELVAALGDGEAGVAEAASETLEALGDQVRDALLRGLETGSEVHGLRVGALIAKLPQAAEALTEAFKSPAVNVQVNAALGLGLLGRDRAAFGVPSLHRARTGGDARTRDAVRRALEMIEPRGETGPRHIGIEGFEERFLTAADFEKHKSAMGSVAIDDLVSHLQDGRDHVRANAALGLAAIGPTAAPAARSIGVRLRDDSPRVRVAAAQALDRIGDAAVLETADDLVGALRDPDATVAETCASVLRTRKARVIGPLVRGLETDDPRHGRRIVDVLSSLPDAADILADAFESPAVNVQVNAAIGLGMLGAERVGKGRKALEGARTRGWERTREAVRKAIDMLDGPRESGPRVIAVDGFETQLLDAAAFADPSKLDVGDLVGFLQDGRAIVRANAATALGAIGQPALGAAQGLGVLLRDDDTTVRIHAAHALDKIGDEAVKDVAGFLVGALRGDARVAAACARVLSARKTRVQAALVKGLEADDETHARRILELVIALPDACEILCDAFDSPAENVQVNAAVGIGMLGTRRAGSQGRKKLEGARTGGFARTREAVFRGLAMLDANP